LPPGTYRISQPIRIHDGPPDNRRSVRLVGSNAEIANGDNTILLWDGPSSWERVDRRGNPLSPPPLPGNRYELRAAMLELFTRNCVVERLSFRVV
jgi:hypothetical protein